MTTKTMLGRAAAIAVLALPFACSAAHGAPGAAPACTRHVTGQRSMDAAQPGDVVCVDAAQSGQRLRITKGGTPDRPVTYTGDGRWVRGIDVRADNVVVTGFALDRPSAPGIDARGVNVTIRDNTITAPQGGDGDGLRFFGDGAKILGNRISHTDNSTGAHADCMQTFATDDDHVASRHVLIAGNRCEHIDNMCLMAEGPHSEAGDGSGKGVSEYWMFFGNYCETLIGSQAVMIDDVQHLSIVGNVWAAGPDHAIGMQNHSTDGFVWANLLDPAIPCEVGMDESSRKGYHGPPPRCAP
ncbi:right-handed parallel beta-helix repeat-containing protein [Amycolatopsis samaneae]|uniref:Right handed beta helix domain-containing protein n=1 Tax=Amycolatopsis samaneae TaxID=664691 RepID=A0ABW5GUK2_9PSEU